MEVGGHAMEDVLADCGILGVRRGALGSVVAEWATVQRTMRSWAAAFGGTGQRDWQCCRGRGSSVRNETRWGQ